MRTFPFVATVSAFICATSFASVLVFDNEAVFNAGLADSSLAKYEQTFDSYSGSAPAFSGGSGNYSWSASSPSGVLGQVGGLFHYVDAAGAFKSGLMKIKLSDGTTFIRSISSQTTFSGFITTGSSITSLELSHIGTTGITYSAAELLTIGFVPTPGALALLGLAGLVSRRRRA